MRNLNLPQAVGVGVCLATAPYGWSYSISGWGWWLFAAFMAWALTD